MVREADKQFLFSGHYGVTGQTEIKTKLKSTTFWGSRKDVHVLLKRVHTSPLKVKENRICSLVFKMEILLFPG